ncbi:YbaB/EbfC family nucleoid-associated protein [Catellatospora sp. KI3]|uniref:YbaB/EbfC family nucleoid-associated protein n=1 Tax=Catellatospora sp. KI3 TaxID=3041620 RepID=UPI00248306E4|nr:YbaB/EbfC family nucleoid-associated protein [Catellatospora sp. KI3]MDI1465267.1 YbaB/EbfC family nucleoid-associated protein [Catellatospora sp. KI3]
MPPTDRDANAALRARFDEVHARYTHLRDNVAELKRRLDGLEVTAKSPDGTVTVAVGARGQLTKLRLHDRAYAHRPERLADLITETTRKAETAAGAAVLRLTAQVVPAEAGVAELLRGGDLGGLLRRHDEALGWRPAGDDGRG